MKRKGNIYPQICSLDNLRLAYQKARMGKAKQPGVIEFEKNIDPNLLAIQDMLVNKTFRTSTYTTFKVEDRKERLVFRLPFSPDRIVHHAIMNQLEETFTRMFISTTYSCIKGKGIHAGFRDVKEALKDKPNTQFCLKIDIRKFYQSINHDILKALLRRKFKDKDLLWLIDEIIDSAPGLPIGNYLSQYLANFYLAYFDHVIKEARGVVHYFRYLDDMVFLHGSKEYLHELLAFVRKYLKEELCLDIKDNYQIFGVDERGIDYLGYVFRHDYIKMRKSIKKDFARAMKYSNNKSVLAAYMGWAKPCDSKHLIKKLWKLKLESSGVSGLSQKQGVSLGIISPLKSSSTKKS